MSTVHFLESELTPVFEDISVSSDNGNVDGKDKIHTWKGRMAGMNLSMEIVGQESLVKNFLLELANAIIIAHYLKPSKTLHSAFVIHSILGTDNKNRYSRVTIE